MPEVERLSDAECWALLGGAAIGRLVFADGDDIEIFPVNFLAHERTILFRSAPGSKLEAVASHPRVAFEVDEHGPIWVWSVIVWGRADRLVRDDEIESSGVLDLVSWSPDEKLNYVRITPDRISVAVSSSRRPSPDRLASAWFRDASRCAGRSSTSDYSGFFLPDADAFDS